ncbi:hypothetical protein [Clostridium lacusfryxellense]|uniref:hypothetical protein n=1 Tax=Clostridium lacusfryxellense TaxID=205328 RepID=UPI001C0BA99C|nr:hypothetical protein [Clostridium lacusfryxellense]MBU3113575.1 hypothetical protein [Clostridium lacusfryxellense]
MKNIIIYSMITILTVVLLVACQNKEVKETPPVINAKLMAPTVIGEVLEVKEDGAVILVDSIADNVKGKILVSIDDKTNFFEDIKEGTSIPYRNVSRKFAVHNHVEIFIEGEIKESNPAQGLATAVYVNESKK